MADEDGIIAGVPAGPDYDLHEDDLPTEPRERKRVLNVLAQRRYRRRKKQKQAMLEEMLAKATSSRKEQSPAPRTTKSPRSQRFLDVIPAPTSNRVTVGRSPVSSDSQASNKDATFIYSPAPSSSELSNNSADSWFVLALNVDNQHTETDSSDFSVNPPEFSSLSDFLQDDEIQSTTFADDFYLNVAELDLLRASFNIASRLHCTDRLWDLSATSTFQEADASTWMFSLPANLQPTSTQLTVAHHPIIDLFPWPSVRNKLIEMYCMPVHFWPRHPDDGTPCSLVRLVYDMEDGGVRVWGADPAAMEAWEVQERFATVWWWALDLAVLRSTNQRRIARGEAPLPAPGPLPA